MITQKEYLQHLKSWKGTIHKTMHKLSQIKKLDYSYQQDLLQVGKIAVYEALIASETNGKSGNDKNGIIAAYIDGKMKTFANRQTDVIRVPNVLIYDQDKREENEHLLPSYQPAEWYQDTTENLIDEEEDDDFDWIDKEAIKIALSKLTKKQQIIIKHKYAIDGYELLTQPQLSEKYNVNISNINNIYRLFKTTALDIQVRLQAKQRKKYGKTIQSTS